MQWDAEVSHDVQPEAQASHVFVFVFLTYPFEQEITQEVT